MVLAREPSARPRVGPAFELHLKDLHFARWQLDLRPEDAVLRAAPGNDLVCARRQEQFRLSARIEVHPAAGETVERTDRHEELSALPLQRHLGGDRQFVLGAHLQSQQGDRLAIGLVEFEFVH